MRVVPPHLSPAGLLFGGVIGFILKLLAVLPQTLLLPHSSLILT